VATAIIAIVNLHITVANRAVLLISVVTDIPMPQIYFFVGTIGASGSMRSNYETI